MLDPKWLQQLSGDYPKIYQNCLRPSRRPQDHPKRSQPPKHLSKILCWMVSDQIPSRMDYNVSFFMAVQRSRKHMLWVRVDPRLDLSVRRVAVTGVHAFVQEFVSPLSPHCQKTNNLSRPIMCHVLETDVPVARAVLMPLIVASNFQPVVALSARVVSFFLGECFTSQCCWPNNSVTNSLLNQTWSVKNHKNYLKWKTLKTISKINNQAC